MAAKQLPLSLPLPDSAPPRPARRPLVRVVVPAALTDAEREQYRHLIARLVLAKPDGGPRD